MKMFKLKYPPESNKLKSLYFLLLKNTNIGIKLFAVNYESHMKNYTYYVALVYFENKSIEIVDEQEI